VLQPYWSKPGRIDRRNLFYDGTGEEVSFMGPSAA
jgi:hypothetical protein